MRPSPWPGTWDVYNHEQVSEDAGNSKPDFSVKSVPATDNLVVGGMLRKYCVDDRILARDPSLPRPSGEGSPWP